jgi:hypothetical protein
MLRSTSDTSQMTADRLWPPFVPMIRWTEAAFIFEVFSSGRRVDPARVAFAHPQLPPEVRDVLPIPALEDRVREELDAAHPPVPIDAIQVRPASPVSRFHAAAAARGASR